MAKFVPKRKRGGSYPGERRGGRKKGTPNKVTKDTRIAITEFIEGHAHLASKLWKRVARKDPARALEILGRFAEYVIPKLARTEVSGPQGGAIPVAQVMAAATDEDSMRAYLAMLKQPTKERS